MAVTKYLDKTGLSHFWSKIKAWANSLFALDSAVVHKTGNETISGTKTFSGSLQLTRTTDAQGTQDNNPALSIGATSGTHIEFDGNEIMAKSSGTTTGPFYINAQGGDVYIGGNTDNYKSVTGRGKGSSTVPVYTNANGIVTACGNSLDVDITGNAGTATKLATTRVISAGDLEFQGSANFDGSSNIVLNVTNHRSIVTVGNTNNYPFHRIAYMPLFTGSYKDSGITFLVSKDFHGGGYGIVRVIFRTNNAASQVAGCTVQWLSRTSDIAVDAIQVGFVKTAGASYLDVFYKSSGAYNSAICRVLACSNTRNGVGRGFTVVSASTEVNSTTATDPKTSIESYKTIADAGTALHNQAYTDIIAASDAGIANSANSCSGNAATVTGTAGTSTLAWNSEVTLYTVGGHAIKAKLPANPNTNTDTLVTQNVSTTNARYPILCCPTADAIANQGAKTSIFAKSAWVNPSTNEIIVNANNTFRSVAGNYGAFWRIDNTAFYLMLTASGDQYGTWTSARPLTVNLSTGICNINGNAANVTGTVAIANGGTGATTRLNAVKALTNENVGTDADFFLTITSSWGKAGYSSVANAKTILGLKSAAYTESSAYATSSHTHSYLPLSGGTLTGNLIITNNHTLRLKHTGITRGTAPSANVYPFFVEFKDNADKTLGGLYYTYSTDKEAKTYLMCYQGTSNANTYQSIGVGYNASGDVFTWAPTPATADSSTKIATTAFVKAQKYLTSLNGILKNTINIDTISTKPSSDVYKSIWECYAKDGEMVADSYVVRNSTGDTAVVLRSRCNKDSHTDLDHAYLHLWCSADGTSQKIMYPTPTADSNGDYGATTSWVRTFCDTTQKYMKAVSVTGSGNAVTAASLANGTLTLTKGSTYITSSGSITGSSGSCTGNAATATKLATTRAINGTNFDGSAAITTSKWGTARNIYIADSDATNTGSAVSVNGSANATLKLPSTIKASLTGNATGLSHSGLGSDYQMTASDFTNKGFGVWKAEFKDNTTSAPRFNDGDFAIIKLYNDTASYAQFLCMSPRRDIIYFGKFWNGTWQKWHEVFSSSQHARLNEGNTIYRAIDTDALWLCGGTNVESSSFISLMGQNHTNAGTFNCVARKGSTYRVLTGIYNGNLTWNGQTIQTSSDARLKTSLTSIPDNVLDAWEDVNWGQFKFLSAIEEKGISARQHVGLIAQQVLAAFNAKDINICDYGIACHDVWDDEYYEDTITGEKTLIKKAGETWMIRYTEALCMEVAYQRRKNKTLENRIFELEKRLAKLEGTM